MNLNRLQWFRGAGQQKWQKGGRRSKMAQSVCQINNYRFKLMSEQQELKNTQNNLNILEIFEKAQIYVPLNLSSPAPDKSLNLEHNNSLALMARHSIQKGLPIPRNMLSYSEDAFQLQDQQYQQKQLHESHFKIQGAEEQLINQLNLAELFVEKPENFTVENTKNMLRNFGNAQNHYVIYNQRARKYIQENINNFRHFDEWVRVLKLENFENFKSAWSEGDKRLYTRVYKKLCWDFYTQTAIPYVLSSRIKNSQTKSCHLRYIYRFLQGLQNCQQFNCFKKT